MDKFTISKELLEEKKQQEIDEPECQLFTALKEILEHINKNNTIDDFDSENILFIKHLDIYIIINENKEVTNFSYNHGDKEEVYKFLKGDE